MSARPGVVRAAARAHWQAYWNKGYRFNRMKPVLLTAALQVAVAGLFLWRISALEKTTLPVVLAAMSIQSGLTGFLGAFVRGRQELYAAPYLPLIHGSPAALADVLLGYVLAEAPRRAWLALWAAPVFAAALPPQLWVGGAALIFAASLVINTLARLAGLLALVFWVWVLPGSLNALWGVLLLALMGLYGLLGYWLMVGVPAQAVQVSVLAMRGWLVAGATVALGIPGAVMLVALAVHPRAIGAVYRSGWIRLSEASARTSATVRSHWPRILGGGAGAVQGKDWVLVPRNRLSLVRCTLLLAGVGALVMLGPQLRASSVGQQRLVCLLIGLGLALFSFGEVMAALFSSEGRKMNLFALSGIAPGQVLLGKAMAGLPFGILSAACSWTVSLIAQASWAECAWNGGIAGVLGVGAATTAVGIAALGVSLKEEGTEERTPLEAALLEYFPSGWAAWAAFGSMMAFGAIGGWIASGIAVLPPAAASALLAVPLVALGAGYARLRQVLGSPG